MSDRMSVDHARIAASGYGTYTINEVRAARTIVAQAEQIKRLQAAFNKALDESNAMGEELYNNMAGPWTDSVPLDYGLHPGDMEAVEE